MWKNYNPNLCIKYSRIFLVYDVDFDVRILCINLNFFSNDNNENILMVKCFMGLSLFRKKLEKKTSANQQCSTRMDLLIYN